MRHVDADLTAYLDGALDPALGAAVEAHLGECAACRAERDRIAAALGTLSALPAPPPPSPGFANAFYRRLAEEAPTRRSLPELLRGIRWRYLAPLAAASAATVVMLVAGARIRADQAEMTRHLELLDDYEVVASLGSVETAEDAEVVAHLDELRAEEPRP